MQRYIPRSTSWRDDGTNSGLQRVELDRGNIIFAPYAANESTISVNSSIYGKYYTQDLANGKGVKVVTNLSSTLANPTELDLWFNGNMFGLVYTTLTGTPDQANPGLMIDGVAYPVPTFPKTDPFKRNGTVLTPRLSGCIITEDLGDGPHYAEIMFPQSTSENRSWALYGYLLDAREGYLPEQRGGVINTVQKAISNTGWTDLTIDVTNSANAAGGKGIRKIHFLNTNPSGSPITISLSTSASSANVFWRGQVSATGPAVDWDPGLNLYNPSYLYAQADAAGAVAAIMENF